MRVITTPSTVYLESIIAKTPDGDSGFSQSVPQYVTSAWVISAEEHIEPVLPNWRIRQRTKCCFRNAVLHDHLECRTPALPRLLRLIETMWNPSGDATRGESDAFEITDSHPDRRANGVFASASGIRFGGLVSKVMPAFQQQDMQRLQSELSAAIKRLDQLPLELAEKTSTSHD